MAQDQIQTSTWRSLGRGAADGLTLGYSPQIEAGIRAVVLGHDYAQVRDAEIARVARHRAEHPNASVAGNIVGIGVGALAVGPLQALGAVARAKNVAEVLHAKAAVADGIVRAVGPAFVSAWSNGLLPPRPATAP